MEIKSQLHGIILVKLDLTKLVHHSPFTLHSLIISINKVKHR